MRSKQNLLLLLSCFLTELVSAARVRLGNQVPVVSNLIDSPAAEGSATDVVHGKSNSSAPADPNSSGQRGSVGDGASGLQLMQGPSPNVRRKKVAQNAEPFVLAPDVPADSLLAVAIRTEAFLGKDGSRYLSKLLSSASVLSAAFLGVLCLALACWASSYWSVKGSLPKGPRQHVEAMARCGQEEVERHLKKSAAQGYDCAPRPVSTGMAVRLEGTIEMEGTAALAAPLTGQSCVLYSAAVARKLHDGMHPVPVAFATASDSFQLAVRGSPEIRVQMRGEDLFV